MSFMRAADKAAVGTLVWESSSGLHEAQADVVSRLGYRHCYIRFDEPIPTDAGIVLVQGPYGTLLPLARQLAGRAVDRRPVLAYWFQQSLSMLGPERVRDWLARTFSDLCRYYGDAGWIAAVLDRVARKFVGTRGRRMGFLGDILWLHKRGMLEVLALSSTVYADYLARRGVRSVLVPRGYSPAYGQILNLDRDIAVLWMGKTRNRRRKRIVYQLRDELARRGLRMCIYDGEENPFIFGQERTLILNRARFVLNVHTQPADELSIRYFIAAANGAVVLTEPGQNKYPFVPGKHLVECPTREMPDTVLHYLEHEAAWQSISKEMLTFVRRELTLEKSIREIHRYYSRAGSRGSLAAWLKSGAWRIGRALSTLAGGCVSDCELLPSSAPRDRRAVQVNLTHHSHAACNTGCVRASPGVQTAFEAGRVSADHQSHLLHWMAEERSAMLALTVSIINHNS